MGDGNPWEQTKRAVKAYKLARVAVRVVRENDLPIEALAEASSAHRQRVAELAGTRVPSDQTWDVMIGLVRAMLAERPT